MIIASTLVRLPSNSRKSMRRISMVRGGGADGTFVPLSVAESAVSANLAVFDGTFVPGERSRSTVVCVTPSTAAIATFVASKVSSAFRLRRQRWRVILSGKPFLPAIKPLLVCNGFPPFRNPCPSHHRTNFRCSVSLRLTASESLDSLTAPHPPRVAVPGEDGVGPVRGWRTPFGCCRCLGHDQPDPGSP